MQFDNATNLDRKSGVRGTKKKGDPDFLDAAPPMFACAAFCKESRMKVLDSAKPHRKSGGSPTIAFNLDHPAITKPGKAGQDSSAVLLCHVFKGRGIQPRRETCPRERL
jgi:hypothetical protein